MKTVLVVGAGRYQRAVIRRARELGLRVVAVDRNPDAPGLPLADVPRVVDFSSPEAVLENVADLEIDGVLTVQAERAVPMVAAIAEALGLPGIGIDTARLMTNKLAMRSRLADAGVPQPRFATVRTPEEAQDAAAEIRLPAVLKPADSAGQVGLARIESPADAAASLPEAVAASPTGEAVLEEFVEGTELNGIVVVQDGTVLSVTLCDRLRPPGRGFGVSWLHLYPPHVEGAQRAVPVPEERLRHLTGGERGAVHARRERAPGAAHHDHPDGGVGGRPRRRLGELDRHIHIQRVEDGGAVQGDRPHPVLDRVEHRVAGHGRCLSGSPRARGR